MKKLLLFGLMACAILSCKEKVGILVPMEDTSKLTAKDVTMENGVLRFASKEHLKNVAKEIGNFKDMENWYSNPEFTSLFKRQKAITGSEYDRIGETGNLGELSDVLVVRGTGDDKILEKIVEDPRFAAVLNSKGYVIVADSAYHIGAEEVASMHLNKDNSNLLRFLDNTRIPGVTFTKIFNEALKNARTQFQRTDGNRRIIAEFKTHNAGVYYSLMVKLRYLKKNWIGTWSGTAAQSLSFTASGTYWEGLTSGIPFSTSQSGSNVEEISYFVDEEYLWMGWGTSTGFATWSPAVNGATSAAFSPND